MKKSKTKGFRLPMHLAASNDDLRYAMQCVYFEGNYMYATDAHLAVLASMSHFTNFEPEEIARLNGKFIHKDKFKKIYSTKVAQITEEGVLDNIEDIMYRFTRCDMKYPSLEKLFTERLAKPEGSLPIIGVNPVLLSVLGKLMCADDPSYDGLHLSFATEGKPNQAIIVNHPHHNTEHLVGILMPIAITK